MKIVIAGGTGRLGKLLASVLLKKGNEVVALSRGAFQQSEPGHRSFRLNEAGACLSQEASQTNSAVPDGDRKQEGEAMAFRTVWWDGCSQGPWSNELEGADVVINLAGRSVNCRYTPENRRQIKQSRVDSTRAIGRAIALARCPPATWLQASTATIYCHRFDAPNDDQGIIGGSEPGLPDAWKFSYDVATSWEGAALKSAQRSHTRNIFLRLAIVMSPETGGVYDMLLRLVRVGLGGSQGSGQQFVSWIHEHDFVRAVEWLIQHHEVKGSVNLAAPFPLPNREFMRVLREVWGHSIGLSTPGWMLEMGAFLLRTETELVLKSRRVTPSRLLESGFKFEFPTWHEAATDLCSRVKLAQGRSAQSQRKQGQSV